MPAWNPNLAEPLKGKDGRWWFYPVSTLGEFADSSILPDDLFQKLSGGQRSPVSVAYRSREEAIADLTACHRPTDTSPAAQ